MNNYVGVNLTEMITQIGEKEVQTILSDFSCPLNPDVEHFLKYSAIEFSKQRISSTYLVMNSYKKEYVLVGYFTLANKIFSIHQDDLPSKSWQRRIAKFAQFDSTINRYTLSIPLIGQLGKNFSHKYNTLITGDELLKLAIDKITEMQRIVGGKMVYLECDDDPKLLDFYSKNGFVNFGKRKLDFKETGFSSKDYFIQMLRYI